MVSRSSLRRRLCRWCIKIRPMTKTVRNGRTDGRTNGCRYREDIVRVSERCRALRSTRRSATVSAHALPRHSLERARADVTAYQTGHWTDDRVDAPAARARPTAPKDSPPYLHARALNTEAAKLFGLRAFSLTRLTYTTLQPHFSLWYKHFFSIILRT